MNFNLLTFLGIIFIYFDINLAWTQRIYSKNRFLLLLAISIALPVIIFYTSTQEYKLRLFNFSLIIFYYSIILWTIKKYYKKLSTFFINKKVLNQDYSNKDFTYVLWDSDIPLAGNWWDKKLATKPSWLDHALTILLLILPFLFVILAYSLVKNVS